LVELMVVILIIGILSSIAVPQYYQATEQGRAQEAVEILNLLNGSQKRYLQKYGTYCYTAGFACAGFDLYPSALKWFTDPSTLTPAVGAGIPSWQITETRLISAHWYGIYTIKFDVEPNAGPKYTCTSAPGNCQLFMPVNQ
jgi:type II secretory pathway pseudopilin PulG